MTEAPRLERPSLTIDLDVDRFTLTAKAHDWTASDGQLDYALIGEVLNVSERQAYRVLNYQGRPGTGFIAELLNVAEETGFRRLFRIVNAADPIGRK